MEDHWWCPGSKREAFIIKVGWDFRTTETPGHSCDSPAVRVCTNTSVSVLQINFGQPTTRLTEVCCVVNSNVLIVFQIYVWVGIHCGWSTAIHDHAYFLWVLFGTAPSALIIVGMWDWSATAKWSCWRPLTSCASIWTLVPGRKTDLLFCVKACTTMESGGSRWKPCWTPFRINSMSTSCESSVAQVSNIKSVETLAALGCCIDSERGPASMGRLSPHSAG